MNIIILFSIIVGISSNIAMAQTWQVKSGQNQIAVLELFTSEGCGLCPAAEHWLHQLPQQGISSENLITLGFHVDYLDDKKGWVDRFASPIFSDRQRQQVRINLYQTIYTPEFIVGGEVIHNWKKHVKQGIHTINDFVAEAMLQLSVEDSDDTLMITTDIEVMGEDNRQNARLYLAVTENDVISQVRGGDNAGITFNHQNLVRTWLGPFKLSKEGVTHVSTSINIDKEWNMNKAHVVAVVQNLEDGFVLQGLELPLY